jgi:hypothetical protein
LRYAQVYFDSSPTRHVAAYQLLASFGDDSANYLWKLHAAQDIMTAYRTDPQRLRAVEALQTAKNSAEEVLHPRDDTSVFADPGDVESAYRDHGLRTFPDDPQGLGLRRDPQMGELASKLDQPRRLYRGLRPPAYALAAYLVRLSREGGAPAAPLTVTSTVRDEKYQRLLVRSNREATQNYSLHTTGWTFDFLRRYANGRQAAGVQFALDRLQALDLIAWVREPAAIHVTVAGDAKRLVPLLRPQ